MPPPTLNSEEPLWAYFNERLSLGLVNVGALPTTNVGQGDARPAPRLTRLCPFQ